MLLFSHPGYLKDDVRGYQKQSACSRLQTQDCHNQNKKMGFFNPLISSSRLPSSITSDNNNNRIAVSYAFLLRLFFFLHTIILRHYGSEAAAFSLPSITSLVQRIPFPINGGTVLIQSDHCRGCLDTLISIRGGSNGTMARTIEDYSIATEVEVESIPGNQGMEIMTGEKKQKKNKKRKKKESPLSRSSTTTTETKSIKLNFAEEDDTKCAQQDKRSIKQKSSKATHLLKKKKKGDSSSSSSSSSNKIGGGKNGECIRRIKHEWRDIVKLGIGYDWIAQQTITTRGRSPTGQKEINNNDHFYCYNYVRLGPFHNNLLHWHFSIRGPSNSDYERGIYHGRIILPKDYPGSPPRVQVLTPSGRFVTGEDICLSASAFHPETWTPRWTILSLVEALRMHMLTTANEIGGLHSSSENRRKFAEKSRTWKAGRLNHGRMVEEGLFHTAAELSEKMNRTNSNSDDCQMVELLRNLIEERNVDENFRNDIENNYCKSKSIASDVVALPTTKTTTTSTSSTTTTIKSNEETRKSGSAQMNTSKKQIQPPKRPNKAKVIMMLIRGIVNFFRKHLEIGIVFVGIVLLFK